MRKSSAGRSISRSWSSNKYEPDLDHYAEAVALIVAAELAQVQLLEEFHGVRYREPELAYGYSLGELAAVACGGVFDMADVLRVPVAMAADCAALAEDVSMGVLFSRGPAIDEMDVRRLCRQITAEGERHDRHLVDPVAQHVPASGPERNGAAIQSHNARVPARPGPHPHESRHAGRRCIRRSCGSETSPTARP